MLTLKIPINSNRAQGFQVLGSRFSVARLLFEHAYLVWGYKSEPNRLRYRLPRFQSNSIRCLSTHIYIYWYKRTHSRSKLTSKIGPIVVVVVVVVAVAVAIAIAVLVDINIWVKLLVAENPIKLLGSYRMRSNQFSLVSSFNWIAGQTG